MSAGMLARRILALAASLTMLHASTAAFTCSLNCMNNIVGEPQSHAVAHLHNPHSGAHTCCSRRPQFGARCNHLQIQGNAVDNRAFVLAPPPVSLVQALNPALMPSTRPVANFSAESPPMLSSLHSAQSLRI